MTDVHIQAQQPDRAQAWRTALERAIVSPQFGRDIVYGTFAEHASSICLNGEHWQITSELETIICSEVAFPMPQLRDECAWIYSGILIEDYTGNYGIFRKCWKDSPTAEACANELRAALVEELNFFRSGAAQERITEKLIA